MGNMRTLLPLFFVLALGFGMAQNTLEGSEWELQAIGGKAVTAEKKPTLYFDVDRATAYYGCNRGNGTYTVSGTALKFGQLISTKMACGEERDRLETEFSLALSKALRYSLSSDGMTLRILGGGKSLNFKRK